MKQLAEKFLTPTEQKKVTQTVKNAELATSGEIVPMIVSQSYEYSKARLIAALLYSLPLAYVATTILSAYLWLDPNNIFFFFTFLAPFFYAVYSVISIYPGLARFFITDEEMIAEVEEEAIKSFFSEKLYQTQNANGILLFISVFEKKTWILADHGIKEKIAQSEWQAIVDELSTEIARDNHCEALCSAITRVGKILQDHFPHTKNDRDELHNLIIK